MFTFILIAVNLGYFVDGSAWKHNIFGWQHVFTPTFSPYIGPQSFNITANVTREIFNDICTTDLSENNNAFRILISKGPSNGCSRESEVRRVQNAKAVGYVWIVTELLFDIGNAISSGVYCLDGSNTDNIKIPYVVVFSKDMQGVLSALDAGEEEVLFRLSPDPNPYLEPVNVFLIGRICSWIILTPWTATLVYLAVDTVRTAYIRNRGFSFSSLPQVACGIEAVSNLIRLVYVSLGPFLTWDIWSSPVSSILSTLTVPLSLLTSLFIAFYWRGICVQSEKLSPILDLRKYRYYILVAFLFEAGFTWARSVVLAMYIYMEIWISISAIAEILTFGSAALFFIIEGRRIIKTIRDVRESVYGKVYEKRSVLTNAISIITRWVFISGLCTVLFLLALLFLASPLFHTRYGIIIIPFVLYVALCGISTTQIIAFRTKMPQKTPVKELPSPPVTLVYDPDTNTTLNDF
jgi:hypothetical protein